MEQVPEEELGEQEALGDQRINPALQVPARRPFWTLLLSDGPLDPKFTR